MEQSKPLCDEKLERYVVGGCLLDYRAYGVISEIIKPRDFFLKRHEYIMQAMANLAGAKKDIDIPMVETELKTMPNVVGMNLYDFVGGDRYLIELEYEAEYKSGRHFEEYAIVIKRFAVLRDLLQASDNLRRLTTRDDWTLSTIERESEMLITKVFEDVSEAPAGLLGEKALVFAQKHYEAETEGSESRLYTGFSGLDNPTAIGGFKKGDFVAVGADSGMGKTAVVVNFSYNFAVAGNVGLFVSKEMDDIQMIRRFLAVKTGIPLLKLRDYTPEDKRKMTPDFIRMVEMDDRERTIYGKAIAELQSLPLYLKHMPDPTPIDIWTEARRIKKAHGRLDYIVVDLITDMTADERDKDKNRATELGKMSGRFKEMASVDNLDCTVFVLSQVKPGIKQRADKRPVKGDFQDSTAIGNQADVQLFFYRDVEYNQETEYPDMAELIIRKQRDGVNNKIVPLYWHGETTRLRNWSSIENFKLGVQREATQ